MKVECEILLPNMLCIIACFGENPVYYLMHVSSQRIVYFV